MRAPRLRAGDRPHYRARGARTSLLVLDLLDELEVNQAQPRIALLMTSLSRFGTCDVESLGGEK